MSIIAYGYFISQITNEAISKRPRMSNTRTYGVFQPWGALLARLLIVRSCSICLIYQIYLKAAQNMPIPRIVIPVPGRSSFLSVSSSNLCFGVVSFGTVKYAIIVMQKYMMAIKKKLALQLKSCVNNPARMLPKTKPIGLPAENAPKDLFFRGLGFSYTVPNMP
jgi:hypothetical protein